MELKKREIFGYSLGGFGKNIAYMMVSSYTLYYYNSVLHVSASFIAVLLMIARIFDAFNDPFMGILVAKTKTKWGKYKPWILSGAVLNSLVMIAMFTVPADFGQSQIKAYITITYFLCGITYTLTDIPYWSVIPAITAPGRERENLTLFTRVMSGLGSGLATAFTMFFVAKLGGGYEVENYRKGFSILACIISAIYTLLTIITVINLPKERYPEAEKYSVKELFKDLIHNDQAIMLSIIIILFYSGTNITMNLALYIFDKDIHRPDLYTPYMIIVGVTEFATMLIFFPLLRNKLKNRSIMMLGFICGIIGYSALFFVTFLQKFTFIEIVIPSLFIAVSIGFAYVLITVFVANAVDYGEAKNGKRQNSMVSSLQTLMSKLATSISIFLTGIGIDWVKFSEAAEQTRDVIVKERLLLSVPSLILLLAALILLAKRKDL